MVFKGKRTDYEFYKDCGYLGMKVEALTSMFTLIIGVEPLPFPVIRLIPFSFPEIALRPAESSMR